MGNRAVIAIGNEQQAKIGIYLHWNGGRASVEAFLAATRELMKSRGPDHQYGPARLVQVIGNFLGGSLSLGLDSLDKLDQDNGNNGVYFVNPESLQIVGRKYAPAVEQDKREYYDAVLAECLQKNKPLFAKANV